MTEKLKKASESVKKMGINAKISAAIYLGSYSIQMLIARVFPDEGIFETINEYTSYSKLAENRPEPEKLSDDGMERAFKALREMHKIAVKQNVTEIRLCASSSFRNTVNRTQFLLGCRKEFGILPQMLGGRDEARLNYIGAMTDAFANLPIISVYIGYSNCQLAFGTSEKIEGAIELDLGVRELNQKFHLDQHGLGFFKQISLHNYIQSKIVPIAQLYHTWRASLKLEPELMAVGPLPFACLPLLAKKPALMSMSSISSVPPTTESVIELSRKLLALNHQGIQKLPGLDPEMRSVILGGTVILRGHLEFCKVYDFRVTPYGLCAGMLKSPSYVFSAVKANHGPEES